MAGDRFSGATVLVTGGAGFVGSNLVKKLLNEGVKKIHIVDNLLSAEKTNVPNDPRVMFTEASITNDKVLNGLSDDLDYIFHLSCYHGNQSSMHDPLADHENNTLTTLKLFERIKGFKNLKKVVYSAAGCAVAEKKYGTAEATEETDIVSLHADTPYSMSKLFGEFYANYYCSRHNLPVVRARFQNVYGPGEILGAGQWRGTPATVWRNVVPTFVYKALNSEALTLENEGASSRDFIFVEDIVEGLIACALKGTPGEAYNLATGKETSIKELATIINEFTGNKTPAKLLPKRDWDNSGNRFGSPEKAKQKLGFCATRDIRDGLQTTVTWTRDNLDVIQKAMERHKIKMPDIAVFLLSRQ